MVLPVQKWIKIRMIEKGISGVEIARSQGVVRQSIYQTIAGANRSRRLRQAICDALDLPYSIWDEIDKKKRAA